MLCKLTCEKKKQKI